MDDDGKYSNNMDNSKFVSTKKSNNYRVKPKFYKLLGQIMNYHMEVEIVVN